MLPITAILAAAKYAPDILKWMGVGKSVQDVATKAVDIAMSVTGEKTAESAMDALDKNPELVLAYQKMIADQDLAYEAGYLKDKADARARDIALSATPHGNVRANWLCAFACLTIFSILFIVIYPPIASQLSEFAKGALSTILGGMLTQLWNIYSFEYGTTRRSREKSDIMESAKERA